MTPHEAVTNAARSLADALKRESFAEAEMLREDLAVLSLRAGASVLQVTRADAMYRHVIRAAIARSAGDYATEKRISLEVAAALELFIESLGLGSDRADDIRETFCRGDVGRALIHSKANILVN